MKSILIILTLLLTSCAKEETIAFGFESQEVAKITLETIKKNNIWYKEKLNGRYEFLKKDIPKIQLIYKEATNKIIPFGRSSGFGSEMYEIMIKKLKLNKVSYKTSKYKGENWIVWEEKDREKVQGIQKEAEKEVSELLLKGLI